MAGDGDGHAGGRIDASLPDAAGLPGDAEESERNFRLAMSLGQTIAYRLDRELRITWLYSSSYGYDTAIAYGKTAFDFLDQESAEGLTALYREVFRTGKRVRADVAVRARAGGPVRYFEIAVEPVPGKDGLACAAHEISDRVEAEARSRAAADRLRFALGAAGMCEWSWDLGAGIVTGCARLFRLFGIDSLPYGGEMSADAFFATLHPTDRKRIRAVVDNGIAAVDKGLVGGEDISLDLRVVLADGTLRWLATRGRVMGAGNGRDGLLTGLSWDVTSDRFAEHRLRSARREAEERAHQAERLEAEMQTILNAVPVAIWVARDSECRIVEGNRAAYDLVSLSHRTPVSLAKYGAGDLGYRVVQDGQALSPQQLSIYRAAHGEQLRGVELQVVKDDGTVRWMYGNAVPLIGPGGEVRGAVSTFADITERKTAELLVQESEERYRTLFEMAPLSVVLVEPDTGRFADFNTLAHEGLGYSCEEFANLSLSDVVADVGSLAALRMGDGHGTLQLETHYRHRDGRLLEFAAVGRRVFVNGKPYLQWMGLDITRLKRAEADLREAKAEAERANIAKSKFLAAASHDLRQPLHALGLYLAVLSAQLADADRPLMTNLNHCLSSLTELLDDMLDVSKLDAGVVTPRIVDFSLGELIDKVVASHELSARAKGLSVRKVGTTRMGRGDPSLLERVLINFLSNAVRYTRSGGVLIGCRRLEGRLWVEVWDTGVGISEGQTAEIFEEFRQLGNPERSREKGSGLGLAIVRKIASLLGQRIRVASRPGKGSVFAIEVFESQSRDYLVSLPPERSGRILRIALIEDDAQTGEAFGCALGALGHQVVQAGSVAEAVDRLGGIPPDCVIADLHLGGDGRGIEAVNHLRAVFGQGVQAVILAGDAEAAAAIAAKGFRVLHKPVEYAALRDFIAALG